MLRRLFIVLQLLTLLLPIIAFLNSFATNSFRGFDTALRQLVTFNKPLTYRDKESIIQTLNEKGINATFNIDNVIQIDGEWYTPEYVEDVLTKNQLAKYKSAHSEYMLGRDIFNAEKDQGSQWRGDDLLLIAVFTIPLLIVLSCKWLIFGANKT